MPEPQRTPLTLEFQPENGGEEDEYPAIVVCEPSFEIPGRVFLGANPFGKRLGVHLLPEETLRLRDHLTMLLLEKPEDQPQPEPESIQSRIDRAVERVKASRQPEPTKRIRFRTEFDFFGLQGIIERR